MTTNALDYILKKFNVPAGAALPIQVPMNRVPDQCNLFAELGFKVGAEIGVDRGYFAADMCKRNPGVKLYGIDPWTPYAEYPEHYNQKQSDECHADAIKNTKPYNVELIQAFSVDAASRFADGSLDYVYIDANHSYDFVLADIRAWAPKVRVGGLVSGHDYAKMANRPPGLNFGVKEAVNFYVKENSIAPWFILRGKGNSGWLWVKA